MTLSGFMITYNEEELIDFALHSWFTIADQLSVLSIVDNGSTDATLSIIKKWSLTIPITLVQEERHRHHGKLRDLALSRCQPGWVMYLDADETWTIDMQEWLRGDELETCDQWEFYKYSTILDRAHTVEGGNGPSRRLFRYREGVGFPQEIHTEPQGPGLSRMGGKSGPWLFDHTACKSPEALWAKGWRYQWAAGVPGIGPAHEYIGRVATAHEKNSITPIPAHVMEKVFTGPL